MSILAASPAPNAVKAMARQKLLGEEVVQEMRFNDGKEGTEKRKEALRKKRGLTKKEMDKHPQFKTEGTSYGITKGSGKPSGQMAAFAKEEEDESDSQKEKLEKRMKTKKVNKMIAKSAKSEKKLAKELMGEMKAPRMQKGAMAYDGPNKERSEAADRVIAKTKAKRAKMKKEEVELGEMKMKMKAKPKNPKDMSKGIGQAAPVDYRTLAQSHVPVGNIFNEKMDPVGKEDKDIDNDGDHDSTDKYLLKRRKAIGKAIAKKRGKVKEGFSAWRIDLDFNEQVKK